MNSKYEIESATVSQLSDINAQGVAVLVELQHHGNYRNYPTAHQRLLANQILTLDGELFIPVGEWWVHTEDNRRLRPEETQALQAKGVADFDSAGRPIHPWYKTLSQNPEFRFACGKGSYYEWGPNYTADPIVMRYDLDEPQVLLIERSDNGKWALPGGFLDPGESGLGAARREAWEETGILIPENSDATLTYQGVVADPRTTLHAWPETTAVRFDLSDEFAATLPTGVWEGSDDAKRVTWAPVSGLSKLLFGSHVALIQQALEEASQWRP